MNLGPLEMAAHQLCLQLHLHLPEEAVCVCVLFTIVYRTKYSNQILQATRWLES